MGVVREEIILNTSKRRARNARIARITLLPALLLSLAKREVPYERKSQRVGDIPSHLGWGRENFTISIALQGDIIWNYIFSADEKEDPTTNAQKPLQDYKAMDITN